MLVTYRGVIQDGKVLFQDASELPDGTEREFPAEVDVETLSDDELVELVHRLREE